jgi:hypothetical protein
MDNEITLGRVPTYYVANAVSCPIGGNGNIRVMLPRTDYVSSLELPQRAPTKPKEQNRKECIWKISLFLFVEHRFSLVNIEVNNQD